MQMNAYLARIFSNASSTQHSVGNSSGTVSIFAFFFCDYININFAKNYWSFFITFLKIHILYWTKFIISFLKKWFKNLRIIHPILRLLLQLHHQHHLHHLEVQLGQLYYWRKLVLTTKKIFINVYVFNQFSLFWKIKLNVCQILYFLQWIPLK